MTRLNEVKSRYPQVVKEWKLFLASNEAQALEEDDFDSLALGFFIGKGVPYRDARWLRAGWDIP